jgi:hypothetical protein
MAAVANAVKPQANYGAFHRTLMAFLQSAGGSWQGTYAALETILVSAADRASIPNSTKMAQILGSSVATMSHQGWQVTFGRCKTGKWINFRRIGR